MRNQFRVVMFTSVMTLSGLSGCREIKVLDQFVEQTVQLEPVASGKSVSGLVELRGNLVFNHTQMEKKERTECDQEICGYDSVYRCHQRERCYNHADFLMAAASPRAELRERDDDDHDGRRGEHGGNRGGDGGGDRGGGWGGDRGGDHGGGGGFHGPRCETYQDCGYENEPRYCQVNCRQVPYWETNTYKTVSPVVIRLTGISPNVADAVTEMSFGVNTNSRFLASKDHPERESREVQALLSQVSREDKNLLVMKAKGLRLKRGQTQFVNLPAQFQRGEPIIFNVEVESTGYNQELLSILGTQEVLPELSTSSSD